MALPAPLLLGTKRGAARRGLTRLQITASWVNKYLVYQPETPHLPRKPRITPSYGSPNLSGRCWVRFLFLDLFGHCRPRGYRRRIPPMLTAQEVSEVRGEGVQLPIPQGSWSLGSYPGPVLTSPPVLHRSLLPSGPWRRWDVSHNSQKGLCSPHTVTGELGPALPARACPAGGAAPQGGRHPQGLDRTLTLVLRPGAGRAAHLRSKDIFLKMHFN